ncbi:unnamed protein product, partial [Rotaria sp. Silwood1]
QLSTSTEASSTSRIETHSAIQSIQEDTATSNDNHLLKKGHNWKA